MEAKTSTNDIPTDTFQRTFQSVVPLIREEWPTIDAAALDATAGDLDQVTALIASHADRTRVAVKRHLLELHAVAARAPQKNGTSTLGAGMSKRFDDLVSAVRRLESLALEEAKKVSDKIVPKAEAKVRENLWTSLLVALGVGMVMGFLMSLVGRRGGRGD